MGGVAARHCGSKRRQTLVCPIEQSIQNASLGAGGKGGTQLASSLPSQCIGNSCTDGQLGDHLAAWRDGDDEDGPRRVASTRLGHYICTRQSAPPHSQNLRPQPRHPCNKERMYVRLDMHEDPDEHRRGDQHSSRCGRRNKPTRSKKMQGERKKDLHANVYTSIYPASELSTSQRTL